MKYNYLCLLICCIILLQSCGKESVEFEKSIDEIELREGNLMDNKDCFELIYPLKLKFPNGTIISVDSEERLKAKIKTWYEINADVKERPALVYPVLVTFEGNKSKRIKNMEQMERLKKHCREKSWTKGKACFTLLYPITYIMPDETEITGDSPLNVRTMIKEWYESNPGVDTKPLLSYPINIKLRNGDEIEVSNEEEMIGIKKRCSEGTTDLCFKLTYPLSYELPDGTTVTGDSEESIKSLINEWYAANPDVKERPDLIYPVDIIWRDGKSYTIADEEEMAAAKEKCKEGK